MLKRLHLENVGPASQLDVAFADRLNIFTGDNGLGKTFILDVAWWLITYGGSQPLPQGAWHTTPSIQYEVVSPNQESGKNLKLDYQPRQQYWSGNHFEPGDEAVLGIYAKVDGSFSIFDSLRLIPNKNMFDGQAHFLEISSEGIWQGVEVENLVVCNGLIRDWVSWQNQLDQSNFSLLWKVIEILFPAHEKAIPGKPTRVLLQDIRDIPTIQLPYATVPVTQLSAGMKRVLCFTYGLVWLWYEHQQAAALAHVQPAQRMFLLIDEMESHLHVQWQRSIFPAILEAIKLLDPTIQVQVLTTTHSPLVLASLEPHFDETQDKLFGFDLVDRAVALEELPWVKLGEVDHWLTSPIFGLSRPRSKEAEVAIDAAYAIMRNADMSDFPESLRSQEGIHQELRRVLSDDDTFWRRWIMTAEKTRVS
jgi:hypothetical protein